MFILCAQFIPSAPRERVEFHTLFTWIANRDGAARSGPSAMFHVNPKYRLFDLTDYGESTYPSFTRSSIHAHKKPDLRIKEREFVCDDESSSRAGADADASIQCHGRRITQQPMPTRKNPKSCLSRCSGISPLRRRPPTTPSPTIRSITSENDRSTRTPRAM